jgi:hypothetical protein
MPQDYQTLAHRAHDDFAATPIVDVAAAGERPQLLVEANAHLV